MTNNSINKNKTNNVLVVRITDTIITRTLKKIRGKDERRKIIRLYLVERIVGKLIPKEYLDKCIGIKNTKTDKHIALYDICNYKKKER